MAFYTITLLSAPGLHQPVHFVCTLASYYVVRKQSVAPPKREIWVFQPFWHGYSGGK